MGKGFAKRKKQAKEMQEQFSKMQEQMEKTEVTGQAGSGLVKITMNGDHEILKVEIKPECVDPEDIEGIQDLIKAAFQDANKQLKEQSPMQNMGKIPGLPDLGAFGF
ncbi:MAG: YbaB/EbfC family nucleoid-associated protein [Waddliaceae bacterium]